MIKDYSQIPSVYGSKASSLPSNKTGSSSSEIVASFKEIMSSMMMTNGMPSSDSQSSAGMGDLMAPLMLMLFEKIIEQQLLQNSADSTTGTGDSTNKISLNTVPEPQGRPVEGVLTQDYHPGHNGLDFGIVVGTPIKTTMDGNVIYAGPNDQGYGNLVIVENGAYRTYYAHLSSIPVAVGDKVTAGSIIGLSGNTGHSTGPHLHYEIRQNNIPIDPTARTLGASA